MTELVNKTITVQNTLLYQKKIELQKLTSILDRKFPSILDRKRDKKRFNSCSA